MGNETMYFTVRERSHKYGKREGYVIYGIELECKELIQNL